MNMNNQNQSPLVPQGSLLQQRNQGRARVKIAVSIVLAVHGLGLVALLMQGCQKEKEPAAPPTTQAQEQSDSNQAPQLEAPTNTAATASADTNPATPPSTESAAPATTAPATAPEAAPATTAPPAAAQDYKIAAGDTFSGLAHKNHVSVKALMDANPGVDPTKLQIGQTIHIPPPAAPAPSTVGSNSTASDAGAGEYVVKSGDTLSKIAATQGTTVRALRAANHLKTDRILVGQKLKIPSKASASPAGATNPPAQ